MPIAELTSLFSSAKVAYDIAKGISSLHVQVERDKAISELLKVLITVEEQALLSQEKTSSIIQEKDQLAKQLLEMDEWKITKNQYKLVEISSGSFVYAPNESYPFPNPVHWLCQNCLDNERKKSILQLQQKTPRGTDIYVCPSCKAPIKDRSHPNPIKPRIIRRLKW